MMARRPLWLLAGLSTLASLPGCAALGGNVRGDFSCSAPDGICAPSSSIDDRALALISGDDAVAPADHRTPSREMSRNRQAAARPVAGAVLTRTQERVLRVVFQPYIDDLGRLHEASAVHVVVARGEWLQAVEQRAARSALSPSPSDAAIALADAMDRLDPTADGAGLADPGAPSPAAVAAARARQADPIAAIKADVATHLAPAAGAGAARGKEIPATSQMQKSEALPAAGKRSVAPGGQGDGASKAVTVGPAAAENAAQQKPVAAHEPRTNPAPLIPAPTVKAPSFPAAIAGEE